MKYFNFLLENEINFTKDETGNYIALVKVLNPQYYAEKEKHRNNGNLSMRFEDADHQEDKSFTKARSSSQQNKVSAKKLSKKAKTPVFEKTEKKKVNLKKLKFF